MATAARPSWQEAHAHRGRLPIVSTARHRARLLAIARRNSANVEDAEEALHDAFILFIDRFDPDGEAPALAWLTLNAEA